MHDKTIENNKNILSFWFSAYSKRVIFIMQTLNK